MEDTGSLTAAYSRLNLILHRNLCTVRPLLDASTTCGSRDRKATTGHQGKNSSYGHAVNNCISVSLAPRCAAHACLCLKIVPKTGVTTTALPHQHQSCPPKRALTFFRQGPPSHHRLTMSFLKDLVAKLPDGFERARAQAIGAFLPCSRGGSSEVSDRNH